MNPDGPDVAAASVPTVPRLPQAVRGATPVATVTTLRASWEVTQAFVAYHLNIGVDHLYLYFDDPRDEALARLADEPRVTCIPCDDAHWAAVDRLVCRDYTVRAWTPDDGALTLIERQTTNANHALALARRAGFDWLVHIDSDELVHAPDGLARTLAATPPDVTEVRFRIREAIPGGFVLAHPFADIDLFKVPASPAKRALLQRLRCRIIYNGEYFRGHAESKCAVRCAWDMAAMGIHAPVARPTAPGRCVESSRIALLHFDCAGFDAWKDKWRHMVTPQDRGMRPNRRAQLEAFRAAWRSFEQDDDDRALRRLYRGMNVPSLYQRVWLNLLGMVERIVLDRRLFARSR